MMDMAPDNMDFSVLERVAAMDDDSIPHLSLLEQAVIEACREIIATGGGKNE